MDSKSTIVDLAVELVDPALDSADHSADCSANSAIIGMLVQVFRLRMFYLLLLYPITSTSF